jgi:hypothetical protein
MPQRHPGRHWRFKSGFLLPTFLCRYVSSLYTAAKKSRCRPAQGQRVKHRYEIADASAAKNKNKKQKSKTEPLSTPG